MQQAQLWVTYGALILGSVCFLIHAWDAIRTVAQKPSASAATKAASAAAERLGATPITPESATVAEVSDLAEALSKLTDSLAKAGPSLTSLIGAVLFYAIAAIGSGALHGPLTSTEAETPKNAQQDDTANADKGAMPPISKKLPPPGDK